MSKRSGKVRRTERYRYLVADPDEARAEGSVAVDEARLAELRTRDTPGHAAALAARQAAEKELQRAVDACYGTVVLRALPPPVQQAFVQRWAERDAAHDAAVKAAEEAEQDPPTEPTPTWAADSLEVELLAACDVDDAHTAQWWAAEFDDSDPDSPSEWTRDERDELLSLCYRVNMPRQPFDLGVLGKG